MHFRLLHRQIPQRYTPVAIHLGSDRLSALSLGELPFIEMYWLCAIGAK
jgi:hypothetical protein